MIEAYLKTVTSYAMIVSHEDRVFFLKDSRPFFWADGGLLSNSRLSTAHVVYVVIVIVTVLHKLTCFAVSRSPTTSVYMGILSSFYCNNAKAVRA